jgi:putative transposase
MPGGGRAPNAGSRAYALEHTAEAFGGAGLGFLKGKSAIHIARAFGGRKRNFVGQHFWARGYLVSTVGKDETVIRRYIQEQEQQDKRSDQQEMFGGEARL